MRRQSGVSVVVVVAALAVLAAAGAGFLAWESTSQLNRLQGELDAAKGGLNKALADRKTAVQDLAVASKEAKDLKVAVERLTTERDGVRASMENAQADGERRRAELALAREQISYLSARSSKDIVRGMPKTASSR